MGISAHAGAVAVVSGRSGTSVMVPRTPSDPASVDVRSSPSVRVGARSAVGIRPSAQGLGASGAVQVLAAGKRGAGGSGAVCSP